MSIVLYPAVVSGDQSQGYRAVLPDFADAVEAGASPGELLAALRLLLLHTLKRLETEGAEWPTPTPMERLQGTVVLVDVQVDDTPVRVNISIGERLLKRIDQAAETASMTRSGYIAAAVRQRLGDGAPGQGEAGDAIPQGLYEEVIAAGRKLNDLLGPQSAVGRTLAELDNRALEGLRELADSVAGAMSRRPRAKSPQEPPVNGV